MSDAEHISYHFYVDAKEYSTDKKSLTGLEIKSMANVPGNYQLFLETEGNHPDRAISDGESVALDRKEEHFFAVPPATFG
ncbi:MAG: multiubiquitin domain-containing protein [Casimicrobiaceae bacterium]